jgi:hypothetical protein
MESSNKGAEKISKKEQSDSSHFPKGYGDVTLRSCDNVNFSFPRGVLSHISPVFNDILRSGGSDKKLAPATIELAEDSETVTQLLHHIDPLLEPLPLEKTTVIGLLKAAKKYQIPKVLHWIELEASKKGLTNTTSSEPLNTSDPLLFLYLGYQLDSKEMIKEGFRRVNTCHIDKLQLEISDRFTVSFLRRTYTNRAKLSALINTELLDAIIRAAQVFDLGKDFDVGPIKSKRGVFSRTTVFHPRPCYN